MPEEKLKKVKVTSVEKLAKLVLEGRTVSEGIEQTAEYTGQRISIYRNTIYPLQIV